MTRLAWFAVAGGVDAVDPRLGVIAPLGCAARAQRLIRIGVELLGQDFLQLESSTLETVPPIGWLPSGHRYPPRSEYEPSSPIQAVGPPVLGFLSLPIQHTYRLRWQ